MHFFHQFRANQLIAIVLFLFSLFYLIFAFQIPQYALPRPVDSDLFPKLLGLLMFLLSIALYFERDESKVKDESEEEETSNDAFWSKPETQIVVTALSIAMFIFLLERAGFVLTTFMFIFGLTWFYGYKRFLNITIVAVSISLGFYFLLTRGLGVYLPPGILPF